MIGRLKGALISKQPPALVVDVNGVGYDVDAPMSTFYRLPELNEIVTLLIHTHVREDALQLYGFSTERERILFRQLIKVSGIGAKLALTILSGVSVEDFQHFVQSENTAALTRMPGVGKKTAERIVIEMRDKVAKQVEQPSCEAGAQLSHYHSSPVEEAVGALIALGYKPNEASRMVRMVAVQDNAEDIIRHALQSAVTR